MNTESLKAGIATAGVSRVKEPEPVTEPPVPEPEPAETPKVRPRGVPVVPVGVGVFLGVLAAWGFSDVLLPWLRGVDWGIVTRYGSGVLIGGGLGWGLGFVRGFSKGTRAGEQQTYARVQNILHLPPDALDALLK